MEQNEKDTDVLAEDVSMTVQELYAQLLMSDELILTVEAHAIEEIKKGLISVKGKENSKLKAKNMPTDESKLSITLLKSEEDTPPNMVRIHIALARRKSFTIAKIEAPSDF